VLVVNTYGPYLNRIPFWEKFSNSSLLGHGHAIVGDDENISIGNLEVWESGEGMIFWVIYFIILFRNFMRLDYLMWHR
jgi:hypothetical protein